MPDNWRGTSLVLLAMLFVSGITLAQKQQSVVINGKAGQASVLQIDGRAYVDLETLARIANGSLSFKANRIVLTLPTPTLPTDPGDDSGLSKDFMKAGIEEIASLREWASPLANAIQNGYPVTEYWVANYREPAVHGLRLASVAATTDADRSALQLLTNEFEAVRQWSNNLVEAHKSMGAAQYAISTSALRDDPLSQKIVTCGRFLAQMLASGSFQDDSTCH
ncbi:MAG: hypothetical protein DMG45_16835 [Acidobacteria bacterium]|nr:MAG: hypothetical protein DMG45_16835 [Acidobacteriota bacterium]